MTKEVNRFESRKELETDGVVSRDDNLSLEELTLHKGTEIPADKMEVTGGPKCE
jgi:hypothetical protein